MAITREAIIQAAEALERYGDKATVAAVREFLGGGSFASISPVLREWKGGRKTTQAVVLDMPSDLKSVMERLGSEFWQAASRLANDKWLTVQAEADDSVADAQAERDETLHEVSRLESAIATLTEQASSAEKHREEAQIALQQHQAELIRVREQLASGQQGIIRLRDDVAQIAQEKERQADEASRLLGQNEELKRELDEARQLAIIERQRAAENTIETNTLLNQLEQAKIAREHQQTIHEQQQVEVLSLKTSVATLEARLDERNAKVVKQEAELTSLREIRHDESRQIATLTAERESSKVRIRELMKECGELRQENRSLLLAGNRLDNEKA